MTITTLNQIGNRLKLARESAGLSQDSAATKLNKTQSYISRCETGFRRIDILELEEFASLYNKPLSYFVSSLPEES